MVSGSFFRHDRAERLILSPEEARRAERNIDRILSGKPSPNPRPKLDPRDIREVCQDLLAGKLRRLDTWNQVLEYYAFRWYPPHELDRRFGALSREFVGPDGVTRHALTPHQEPEWRRLKAPRHTFTESDLVSLFDSPAGFDRWMRSEIQKWRARNEGIKVVQR